MKIPLTPLRFMQRAADLYGNKEAIVSGESRFTYGQFCQRCERLASALVKTGVKEGEPVALLSFNTHRLLEAYFGVPQARAIVMPLNVRLTPPEVAAILNHSEARHLFFETDFAPLVGALRQACPKLELTINLDTEYDDFIASGKPERADIFSYDENSIAELFYTSGSTGTPKGVMLSHRTVYLHATGVVSGYDIRDTDVELHTIPLFHANGWGRPQIATMLGLTQVMVRRFVPADVCRLIQDERATSMSLVPTMAGALLMYSEVGKYNYSSLRQIHIGGAAASTELVAKMEQVFRCEVLAGYGLTETSPVAATGRVKGTLHFSNDIDRYGRQAMAGWPIVGTEIRVVDSAMNDVPRDMTTVGEVIVRGDNVMDGYFKEPEATAAVMSGAWFHTGDMAVWDGESYIHIVDRKKDIIISGGENISSIEIEKVIGAHPGVMEVAVVAVPHQTWGEVPVAFVVLKPDANCTEQELRSFLEPRLAKFKLPYEYHFAAEALPKGGTGKILKRALREPFWQDKTRRVQG